jgi:cbb3-type cytochrome oxidase subunit 3
MEKLHLKNFEAEYGLFVGIIFLLSTALLFLEFVLWVWSIFNNKIQKNKSLKIALKELNQLDFREISILREFYIQGQSTLKLPMNQPVVAGLIEKGVLKQVGSLGESSFSDILISLSIPTEIKSKITNEFLKLPNTEPNESEIQWIRENLPDFVIKIEKRNNIFNSF